MYKGSGPALAVIGVLGFSFKAILVKLAYSMASIDAVTLLALRMIYAAPFFAVMAWWATRREGATPIARTDWIRLAWLGFIGYYVSSLLDSWDLSMSPPRSSG
jgi:drug/metabolite transporter (DMT)-like permease